MAGARRLVRRGEAGRVRLADHEVVWMRTDPPVDEDYLAATFVLDHADTTVVNDPTGLRSANEKLLVLQAPEVSPPTILTAARTDLVDFTRRHGTAVIKPVQGMAGRGILLLRESDPNLSSIIDGATRRGRRLVVAQAYLPECSDGDRRLILVGGEPLGVVRRLASGSDFRCNMATGAQVRADEVTSHDRDICRHLAPLLERHGLFFVGLDVIGDLVTEINVTSPTGLREVDLLSGTCLGDDVVAWAEGHVDRCRR